MFFYRTFSRFELVKAEDAPGDAMMNALEKGAEAIESEEGALSASASAAASTSASLASQPRSRLPSTKSDASSVASSTNSMQHRPKDKSQLLQVGRED